MIQITITTMCLLTILVYQSRILFAVRVLAHTILSHNFNRSSVSNCGSHNISINELILNLLGILVLLSPQFKPIRLYFYMRVYLANIDSSIVCLLCSLFFFGCRRILQTRSSFCNFYLVYIYFRIGSTMYFFVSFLDRVII